LPALNLQPDELLGTVVKRLRTVRSQTVRPFLAPRWQLHDLARRLDE
jgi:hypothetical protein